MDHSLKDFSSKMAMEIICHFNKTASFSIFFFFVCLVFWCGDLIYFQFLQAGDA